MAENTSSPGNIKDKAENFGAAAGRKVGEGLAQSQQAASNIGQKAQETASQLGQKAQEAASSAAHKAQDAASAVAGRAEDALASVGDRMSSWGSTLREQAPHEGMVGSAASSVADQLQSGGRYLQEHGFRDMTEDLTAVVRHYPVQSVLLALGVGFFAGMASRR
jgi:hypothetical protein